MPGMPVVIPPKTKIIGEIFIGRYIFSNANNTPPATIRPAIMAGITANNGEYHLSVLTNFFLNNDIIIAYVASSNGIIIAIGKGASGGIPVKKVESIGVSNPTAAAHVHGKNIAAIMTGRCIGKNILPASGIEWNAIGKTIPTAVITAAIIMCLVLLFCIIFLSLKLKTTKYINTPSWSKMPSWLISFILFFVTKFSS